MSNTDTDQLLLIIIAILLPPLAVYLKEGAGTPLVIDLVLCLCFWFPGIIYALYVLLKDRV